MIGRNDCFTPKGSDPVVDGAVKICSRVIQKCATELMCPLLQVSDAVSISRLFKGDLNWRLHLRSGLASAFQFLRGDVIAILE